MKPHGTWIHHDGHMSSHMWTCERCGLTVVLKHNDHPATSTAEIMNLYKDCDAFVCERILDA